MKESTLTKNIAKIRRIRRVRAKVRKRGRHTRLSLHISNQRMYAQCIDDARGNTLIAAVDTILGDRPRHTRVDRANAFGKKFAELAKANGIEKVIFDRGGRAYHGRIKAFADGARAGGLQF